MKCSACFFKKIILVLSSIFLIASCAKKEVSNIKDSYLENQKSFKNSSLQSMESFNQSEKIINPEVSKIEYVFSQMSERFKSEVKFEQNEYDNFINDLNLLLQEDKKTVDDISLFYLVDKKHFLSSDYVPRNLIPLKENSLYKISKNNLSLRKEAEEALKELSRAALNDGITLTVSSTYRSYEYQDSLFSYWVKVDGIEEAERESARAGTSQHQAGCAIDFGNIEDSFINTKEGLWLSENAHKYGWSLSFPKGYEDVTGYRWECWHYRYLGKTFLEIQQKWFNNIQQFALEFFDIWKNL